MKTIYNMKIKKLKDYAKENDVTYRTAWQHFKDGKIEGAIKNVTGRVLIKEFEEESQEPKINVVCYARVSSSVNKSNLETQAERLVNYSNAIGLKVNSIIKEIGSGLNDTRPKLLKILEDQSITHIVVEHKDRLTRFGFNFLESWLESQGRKLIVINQVESDKEDLMQDFVSLVTSFTARLYGQRRSRRKTEKLIKELNSNYVGPENDD